MPRGSSSSLDPIAPVRRSGPTDWSLVAYNAAILAGSPWLAAYLAWRIARGKSRAGWSERWGRLPASVARAEPCAEDGSRVWCHAASVGEVMAAVPILRALKDLAAPVDIVMTTITPGGHEVASGQLGKLVTGVSYLPFDVLPIIRRAVRSIAPDLFVGIETEIWPNLLGSLRRMEAPAALVNARISDKSFPRYRRVRWLVGSALSAYGAILAQTQGDAERFLELGAPADRVSVTGNVKFDQADEPLSGDAIAAMRAEFRLPANAPVWVVGSTRTAEEERLIWAAHHLALQSLPGLILIHAPRHVERAGEVLEGLRAVGIRAVRRTEIGACSEPFGAIVLDTFGELAQVYALGAVAFVGNSLVAPGGGQNPIQPLAQGKPVLMGPYVSNFRDVVAEAAAADVAYTVVSVRELASRLVTLVQDAGGRRLTEERARTLIRSNRGAARRTAEQLVQLLRHRRSPS